jgi:hypothetical protein
MSKPYKAQPTEGIVGNLYKTRNIELAITLSALGHPIIGHEAFERLRIFIFSNTPELQDDIDGFWSEDLKVEPRKLLRVSTDLRSKVRDNR